MSVAGLDVLHGLGVIQGDLRQSTLQKIEYCGTEVVVVYPEVTGLLLFWVECTALGILHREYP